MANQMTIEAGSTATIAVGLDETTDKEVYLVVSGSGNFRKVWTTADGTLKADTDKKTFLAPLTSDVTRKMSGKYYIELALKSSDDSYVNIGKEAVSLLVSDNNVSDVL